MRHSLILFFIVFLLIFSVISESQHSVAVSSAEGKISPQLLEGFTGEKRVIVQLKNPSEKHIGLLSADKEIKTYDSLRMAVVEVDRNELNSILADPNVEKVYLDHQLQLFRETSIPHIGADSVWNTSISGQDIKVAVIDTGVGHTDVNQSLIKTSSSTNCISYIYGNGSGTAGSCDDDDGHGTHVAGIIMGAYQSNNVTCNPSGGRPCGVAPNASLIAVKVFNQHPDGYYALESDIMDGMDWAISQGADIVSLSAGVQVDPSASDCALSDSKVCYCYESALSTFMDSRTKTKDTIFVVAAGNNGPYVAAPACSKEAIAVGAVDSSDEIAFFSNIGEANGTRTKPDIVAPGVYIKSTWSDGSYKIGSGTSASAPHVSGTLALILEKLNDTYNITNRPDIAKALLYTAVKDLGDFGLDSTYGFGLVNASEAIKFSNYFINDSFVERDDDSVIFYVNMTNATKDLVVTVAWKDDITNNSALTLKAETPGGMTVSVQSSGQSNMIQFRNGTYETGLWKFTLNETYLTGLNKSFVIASTFPIEGPRYTLTVQAPVEDGNYTASSFEVRAKVVDGDGAAVSDRFTLNPPKFNITRYSDGAEITVGILDTTEGSWFYNSSSTLRNTLSVGRYKVNITAQNRTRIANKLMTFNIISNIQVSVVKPSISKMMRGDTLNLTVGVSGNTSKILYVNYSVSYPNNTIKYSNNLTQQPNITKYENTSVQFLSGDPQGNYLIQIWVKAVDEIGYSSFNVEVNNSFLVSWSIDRWQTTDAFYFLPSETIWVNGTVNYTNGTAIPNANVEVRTNSSANVTGWDKNTTTTASNGKFYSKFVVGNRTGETVGSYELVINVTDSKGNQFIYAKPLYVTNYVGNATPNIAYTQTDFATLNDSVTFLVKVTNSTGSPVYKSNVTISNSTIGFYKTQLTNESGYASISWIVSETVLNGTHPINISATGPIPNNQTVNATSLSVRTLVIVFNQYSYYISVSNTSVPVSGYVRNHTSVENVSGGVFNSTLAGYFYNGSKRCAIDPLSNYTSTNATADLTIGKDGSFTVFVVPPGSNVRGTYNVSIRAYNVSGGKTLRGYNTTRIYAGVCSDGQVYDKYSKGSSSNETTYANLLVNPNELLTFKGYIYYGVERDVANSSISNISIFFKAEDVVQSGISANITNSTVNLTNDASGYATAGVYAPNYQSIWKMTVNINDTTHNIETVGSDDFSFEFRVNNSLNVSNFYVGTNDASYDVYDQAVINAKTSVPPQIDYDGNISIKGQVYYRDAAGGRTVRVNRGNVSLVDRQTDIHTRCGNVTYNLYTGSNDFYCSLSLPNVLSDNSRLIGRNSSYIKLAIDEEYGIEGNVTFTIWVRDLNITDNDKKDSSRSMFSSTSPTVGDAVTVRGYVLYRNENVSGSPTAAASADIHIFDSVCRQDGSATDDHDYDYPEWSSSLATTDSSGYFSFSYYPNCTGSVYIKIRAIDDDSIKAEITSNTISVASSTTSATSTTGTGGATTTTVKPSYLAITSYPATVSVEENKTTTVNVTVTSKYAVTQTVELKVLDLNSSWYSVSSSQTIAGLGTGQFDVTFSALTATVGNYNGKFNASSSYDSHTVDFILKVTPGPQKQVTINDTLIEYESEMLTLESQVNRSKQQGYNMSLAEDKLDQLKRQLNLAKAYRDRDDYTSAYELFTGISVLINETHSAILEANPTIGQPSIWDWLKWVVVVAVVIGVGVVAYLFWPSGGGKPSIKLTPQKYVFKPQSQLREKAGEKFDALKEKYRDAVDKVKEKVGREKTWRQKK